MRLKFQALSLDKKFFAFVFLLFLPSFILFCALDWFAKHFKSVTLDAVFFTLNAQVDGAPVEVIYSFVRNAFLVPLGVSLLLASIIVFAAVRFGVRKRFVYLGAVAAFCTVFINAAIKFDVYGFVTTSVKSSTLIDDNYRRVTPADVVFPAQKKNLILLVGESLENTFHSEDVGWNLIPQLQGLQKENVSFFGQRQVYGTGWTVGGITSMLFGIPLKLPIYGNRYDGQRFNSFLPGAGSILEVLEGHGYSINVLLGSNVGYGGRGNLFKTHSKNCNIYDVEYFKSRMDAEKFKLNERWGARDKLLFQEAKDVLTRLREASEPFFMFILTVDTHTPAIAYGDYPTLYGDERDAFIAADHMLKEFLDWLEAEGFSEDSVVAVIGDHLYMGVENSGLAPVVSHPRSTYNVFLNTEYTKEEVRRQRQFATLDIAPTLLESIGCKLPDNKFGLGVSLFSDDETLLEKYGFKTFDEELAKRSELYHSFFGF